MSMIVPLHRVTPMSVKHATIISSDWMIPGQHISETVDSQSVGCLVYLTNNTPCALALLEVIENQIVVWGIASKDFESGTKLVASLCAQERTKLYFSRALHPRWLVARDFFFIQRREKEDLPKPS